MPAPKKPHLMIRKAMLDSGMLHAPLLASIIHRPLPYCCDVMAGKRPLANKDAKRLHDVLSLDRNELLDNFVSM